MEGTRLAESRRNYITGVDHMAPPNKFCAQTNLGDYILYLIYSVYSLLNSKRPVFISPSSPYSNRLPDPEPWAFSTPGDGQRSFGEPIRDSGGPNMNRSRSAFIRMFLLTLLLLSVVPAVHAQFKAGVQGTVTDTTGGLVPEAKVMLTNNETTRAQEVTTNSEGFYRISGLAPGAYTLTIEKPGYKKSVIENVAITAEAVEGIDVALEIGEVTASVTIDQGSEAYLETE